MTLLEWFSDPREVTVDLLREIPTSNDRLTWLVPTWQDYRPARTTMAIEHIPGQGGLSHLSVKFQVTTGLWIIKGAAVCCNGIFCFFVMFDPDATVIIETGEANLEINTIIYKAQP